MLSDEDADSFFAEIEQLESSIDQNKLSAEYGEEQFTYEATPYSYIQEFLTKFSPSHTDVVYDLGSGYGRLVIFGALNSDADFRGIEISEARNKKAAELAKRLGISNAAFYTGNVLDFDLSDGDIFFLFNPFNSRTLSAVGEKLHEISLRKTIKIATWGGASDEYFEKQTWIHRVTDTAPESPLEYFVSE